MSVYVSLRMFACLFVWLLPYSGQYICKLSLLLLPVLIFWYNPYYHQLSPINFYFIFSFVHSGSIQDIKFERHGLPLPVRCMRKPFEVNINYFVRFVSQRVTFCFCLFFLTPIFVFHLISFDYNGKGARDVGLTNRCHLSNIKPDVSSMIDRDRR